MRIATVPRVAVVYLIGLVCAASSAATSTASAAPVVPDPPPAATPNAQASTAPSSGAAPADARALLARVIDALGGRSRVEKVRDVQSRGEVTAKAAGGDMSMQMETTMVFPDRLSQHVDGPLGRFGMVATSAGAWVQGPEGAKDLPPGMRDEFLHQIQRTAFFLAQRADDPKLVVQLGGEEEVGGIQARALDLTYEAVSVRWFVDPATGRILRASHDSNDPGGKPIHVVSDFTDFRDVDGYSLPFKLEVTTDGSPDQSVVIEEIKINPGADPKLFLRPPEKTPTPKPAPTAKPKK